MGRGEGQGRGQGHGMGRGQGEGGDTTENVAIGSAVAVGFVVLMCFCGLPMLAIGAALVSVEPANVLGIILLTIACLMTVIGIVLIILICAGVFSKDRPPSHVAVVYPAHGTTVTTVSSHGPVAPPPYGSHQRYPPTGPPGGYYPPPGPSGGYYPAPGQPRGQHPVPHQPPPAYSQGTSGAAYPGTSSFPPVDNYGRKDPLPAVD